MFAFEVLEPQPPHRNQLGSIVKASYKIADAMIKEGQKPQENDSNRT